VTVEAEIKARLADPAAVRQRLDRYAAGAAEMYRDTYLDTADGQLDRADRELRLRTIERDGEARHLLTFKEPAVDPVTRSKPEHETAVTDPQATLNILVRLGYRPVLAFTKDCRNYRFSRGGRDFLATLATVPELDGTYLEVETPAQLGDVDDALAAVHAIVAELGVVEDELTVGTYTEAVRAARLGVAEP
jgi:adenylate cyclase, class 2